MHHGDGLHAALCLFKLFFDLTGLRLARLEPEQRRDRLQVVLDTMVDLRDRGVLGLQFDLTPAQLGDVTAQDDRPGAPVVVVQGQRPDGYRGSVGVDFGIHCILAHQHHRQRLGDWIVATQQVGADFAEEMPLHRHQASQPSEAADGVGRGVAYDALLREHDEAVRDTRDMALAHDRVDVMLSDSYRPFDSRVAMLVSRTTSPSVLPS